MLRYWQGLEDGQRAFLAQLIRYGITGGGVTLLSTLVYWIAAKRDDGRPRLAAILDFDSAWAGAPESDLARLDLWQSSAYPGLIDEGFRTAYEAAHTMAPGYRQRRPIYQLLWCLEYADASPQHAADTARVCMELGIAPITFM